MISLLVITNNPSRPSFRQRIEQFNDHLLSRGIDCQFVKYPPAFFKRIGLLKSSSAYDAVFVQKRRFNALEAPVLRKHARKIIYDFDDAVMISDKNPNRPDRKRLRQFARTASLADCVVAGNEYLADKALKYNKNTEILHTSLNVCRYDKSVSKPSDGKLRLVWIGSRSTLMYLRAISRSLEELGRLHGNLVLRIICDDFFDLENMEVEKCRWSLETQADDLLQCDIALAPLDNNHFTKGKCAFKILQYHACGLPVVAASVGFNCDVVQEGKTGLLADSNEQWIRSISSLIDDASLRQQLGSAGKQQAAKFDIVPTAGKLADIIIRTVNK